jgi:hypothetical protein
MTPHPTAPHWPIPAWQYVEKIVAGRLSRRGLAPARMPAPRLSWPRHQADQALRLLSASARTTRRSATWSTTTGTACSPPPWCCATAARRGGRGGGAAARRGLHHLPVAARRFRGGLLGAYVSERNHWMLQHHAVFQNLHSPQHARRQTRMSASAGGPPAFRLDGRVRRPLRPGRVRPGLPLRAPGHLRADGASASFRGRRRSAVDNVETRRHHERSLDPG